MKGFASYIRVGIMAFVLGFLIGKWPKQAPPSHCALCSHPIYEAPCLLTVATGQVKEIKSSKELYWGKDGVQIVPGPIVQVSKITAEPPSDIYCPMHREYLTNIGGFALLDLRDPVDLSVYALYDGADIGVGRYHFYVMETQTHFQIYRDG